MDENSLWEALRILLLVGQVVFGLIRWKKEKALIDALEKHDQSLKSKKKVKKKS